MLTFSKGSNLCSVNVSPVNPEAAQVSTQQHHQNSFSAVNTSPFDVEINLPSAQRHNPEVRFGIFHPYNRSLALYLLV
jgi:hypothetical protein